jgi:hypothetical protein
LNKVRDEQIIKAIYEESGKAIDELGKGQMNESNFAKDSKGNYIYNEKTRSGNISFAKSHKIYNKSMKYFYSNSTEIQISVWRRLNVDEKNDALKLICKPCVCQND